MAEIEEQLEELEEPVEEDLAEREARRRYVYATVRQYPDPVLRMTAREVTAFDEALATLAARMVYVMQKARGVGLAAPQVGVLQRVLVHQADENGEPVVLVNPVVVTSSDELETIEEGCLSLDAAGVTVEVERPAAITVAANDVSGGELRFEAAGLEARVIQHEVDHLDGVLIVDRAAPDQRRSALAKLRPQPVLGRLG
ncbi:MAG: peptide deformylase [Thermoleophilia bacterium]|nr:peptide deformylase [Thermoleophilia bacterium]